MIITDQQQQQQRLSDSLWELKETAKWARQHGEKQAAIKSLSAKGEEALASLEEILAVTAYADIRLTCEEAIRSVRERNFSSAPPATEKSSSEAEKPKKADVSKDKDKEPATTTAPPPAKEKPQKASGSNNNNNNSGSRLADLPP